MTYPLPEKFPEQFTVLINAVKQYNSNYAADLPLLYKAYRYAEEAHKEQYRQSGEPYFQHLYHTALILAELNMDTATICAGLLHDILEDTNISEEIIINEFSPQIVQ
ncbi:MAG: HD domain-containing protein, partial [FCB group bacterium]|nr:HD domain-containing protein [FCB group bacterium]